LFQKEIGINFIQRDEIESLINGLDFLFSLKGIESPIFSFEDKKKKGVNFKNKRELYPYLFVQCGSGISIILVKDKGNFTRVSGSTLGGGTFNGLVRLLTGHTDFQKAIESAKDGDHSKVDLLVGDIYGKDYGEHGLSAETIASTFGKIGTMKIPKDKELKDCFSPGDAIKSLLMMIANNISQISILNATKYKAKNVIPFN
jgi:pantothenate kinase